MEKKTIEILKKHGCLYMKDDYKDLLEELESYQKQPTPTDEEIDAERQSVISVSQFKSNFPHCKGSVEFGFNKAIEWLRDTYQPAEQQNWISVEDGLPEKDGFYNVVCETDEEKIKTSLWFEDGKWKFDNECDSGRKLFETSWYIGVLYWMPLPEFKTPSK